MRHFKSSSARSKGCNGTSAATATVSPSHAGNSPTTTMRSSPATARTFGARELSASRNLNGKAKHNTTVSSSNDIISPLGTSGAKHEGVSSPSSGASTARPSQTIPQPPRSTRPTAVPRSFRSCADPRTAGAQSYIRGGGTSPVANKATATRTSTSNTHAGGVAGTAPSHGHTTVNQSKENNLNDDTATTISPTPAPAHTCVASTDDEYPALALSSSLPCKAIQPATCAPLRLSPCHSILAESGSGTDDVATQLGSFIRHLPERWSLPVVRAVTLQCVSERLPSRLLSGSALCDLYGDLKAELDFRKYFAEVGRYDGYGIVSMAVDLYHMHTVAPIILRLRLNRIKEVKVQQAVEDLVRRQQRRGERVADQPASQRTRAEVAIQLLRPRWMDDVSFGAHLAQGVVRSLPPGPRLFVSKRAGSCAVSTSTGMMLGDTLQAATNRRSPSRSLTLGASIVVPELTYASVSFEHMPSIFLKKKAELTEAQMEVAKAGDRGVDAGSSGDGAGNAHAPKAGGRRHVTPYFSREFVSTVAYGNDASSIFCTTLAPEFLVGMSSFLVHPMRAMTASIRATLHRLYNALTTELLRTTGANNNNSNCVSISPAMSASSNGISTANGNKHNATGAASIVSSSFAAGANPATPAAVGGSNGLLMTTTYSRQHTRSPPVQLALLYVRGNHLYYASTPKLQGKLFIASTDLRLRVIVELDDDNQTLGSTVRGLASSTRSLSPMAAGGTGTANIYEMPYITRASVDLVQLQSARILAVNTAAAAAAVRDTENKHLQVGVTTPPLPPHNTRRRPPSLDASMLGNHVPAQEYSTSPTNGSGAPPVASNATAALPPVDADSALPPVVITAEGEFWTAVTDHAVSQLIHALLLINADAEVVADGLWNTARPPHDAIDLSRIRDLLLPFSKLIQRRLEEFYRSRVHYYVELDASNVQPMQSKYDAELRALAQKRRRNEEDCDANAASATPEAVQCLHSAATGSTSTTTTTTTTSTTEEDVRADTAAVRNRQSLCDAMASVLALYAGAEQQQQQQQQQQQHRKGGVEGIGRAVASGSPDTAGDEEGVSNKNNWACSTQSSVTTLAKGTVATDHVLSDVIHVDQRTSTTTHTPPPVPTSFSIKIVIVPIKQL